MAARISILSVTSPFSALRHPARCAPRKIPPSMRTFFQFMASDFSLRVLRLIQETLSSVRHDTNSCDGENDPGAGKPSPLFLRTRPQEAFSAGFLSADSA